MPRNLSRIGPKNLLKEKEKCPNDVRLGEFFLFKIEHIYAYSGRRVALSKKDYIQYKIYI
jgi:hypothetical protein